MLSAVNIITKILSWPSTFPASFYPIALLHMVAEFHEQIFCNLFLQFFAFHSSLNSLQSGICSNHSTETSLVKICDAKAHGLFSVPSILDLLAAFDWVSQVLLPAASTVPFRTLLCLLIFLLSHWSFLLILLCLFLFSQTPLSILTFLVSLSCLKAFNSNLTLRILILYPSQDLSLVSESHPTSYKKVIIQISISDLLCPEVKICSFFQNKLYPQSSPSWLSVSSFL